MITTVKQFVFINVIALNTIKVANEIQAIKLNVQILFPLFEEKKKKCQEVASVGPGNTC